MTLVAYGRNLEILYETPKDVPVSFAVDRAELRRTLGPLTERTTLSEAATKQLLEAYGIPGTLPRPASSAEEAVQHARQIGYPVVLKVLSPEISHKSDVGGVALDLRDDGAVRIAYEGILGMARQRQPAARLSGVTVQPMVRAGGAEMILGTRRTDLGSVSWSTSAACWPRSGAPAPSGCRRSTSGWRGACWSRCGAGRCSRATGGGLRSTWIA
jgi:acetyltransferase